jgi:hypothetical protein
VLKLIVLFWLVCVATWVFYLAAMSLRPRLKMMHPVARFHGYVVFVAAVLIDAALHFVVGSAVFCDLPVRGELLLTARLKRYHGPAYAGSWRANIAEWVCEHLLDQFDPRGKHC